MEENLNLLDENQETPNAENVVNENIETSETSNNSNVEHFDENITLENNADIDGAKWYVLHTFSGYENVAKENLEIVTEKYSLQHRIFDIVIPMEDVVEEKNGKRKIVSRKVMPGYILVKMIYGDDIWHAVTRTRGITGFVGPKGRPLHLTEEEIRKMRLEKVVVINTDLEIGDKVEVLEGALNGFLGSIVSLDTQANKCRVMVEMFGRETPVDLSLEQIRKVD